MFSGSVVEYVDGREPRNFGDLGKLFGEALRARLADGRGLLSIAMGAAANDMPQLQAVARRRPGCQSPAS